MDDEFTHGDLGIWSVTGFYGMPERHKCRESWDLL